jgi:4-amino-4-deoxy-L-arabinose transferase-like glycosyltransferase
MSDTAFALGTIASTLGPAVLVAWFVRRMFRKVLRAVLAVVLIVGAGWLGMGAFVGHTFSDFSAGMDD